MWIIVYELNRHYIDNNNYNVVDLEEVDIINAPTLYDAQKELFKRIPKSMINHEINDDLEFYHEINVLGVFEVKISYDLFLKSTEEYWDMVEKEKKKIIEHDIQKEKERIRKLSMKEKEEKEDERKLYEFLKQKYEGK